MKSTYKSLAHLICLVTVSVCCILTVACKAEEPDSTADSAAVVLGDMVYSMEKLINLQAEVDCHDCGSVSFDLFQPGRLWKAPQREYRMGIPIEVVCVWTNHGECTCPIPLKMFHRGEILDVPFGMVIKVTDAAGEILTGEGDGWFDYSQRSSDITLYELGPGDVALLPPGGVLMRPVRIDRILLSIPEIRESSDTGMYRTLLRIGGLVSDEYVIRIVE